MGKIHPDDLYEVAGTTAPWSPYAYPPNPGTESRYSYFAETMPRHAATAAVGHHEHEKEPVDIANVGIVGWLCKLCDWAYIADEWIRYGKSAGSDIRGAMIDEAVKRGLYGD